MLSVVIATQNSEQALVPTLSALVAGAAGGILREVIITDAGSSDGTVQVADATGCRVLLSAGPLGARLKAAANDTRADWLFFLRPGVSLESNWVGEVTRFLEEIERLNLVTSRAGIFRQAMAPATQSPLLEALMLLKAALGARPTPDQGLIIHKRLYASLGGHRSDVRDTEADLLARIGRSRLTILRSAANQTSV